MARAAWEKHAHSVADLRAMARRRLPRMVFDFCDGAAEDEITLARNEQAFHEIEFIPQPLVLTTDNQVLGLRERDLRNGFTIPPRVTMRNALDMVRCLPWLLRLSRT